MKKIFKSTMGKDLLISSYNKLLDQWGIEKQEIDIDTSYGKTHVILAGKIDNPPLLLLHGTNENSAIMWFDNAQELAKDFYIIAVDTLGAAGKSEPNENFFNHFNPTIWINEILDGLKIQKVHIVGVSYGVNMGLNFCVKSPDRVERLVCIAGIIPLKGVKFFLLTLRSVFAFFPEILKPTEENAKKLLKKLSGPKFDDNPDKQELFEHFFYILKYSIPVKRKMHSIPSDSFKAFRNKCLFLIGDHDRANYHPSILKILDEQRLKYNIVKGAGHTLNSEFAELTNSEIKAFLL